MYRFLRVLWFIPFFASCGGEAGLEPAQSMFIDDGWRFTTGDNAAYAEPYFDDSLWGIIYSDRPWELQGYAEYDGYAWYRKKIQIPEFMRRKSKSEGGLLLSIGVVNQVDAVYVNGKQVASSGAFPPFSAPESGKRLYLIKDSFWKFGQENTIAIRVYNIAGEGGIVADSIDLRTITILDQIDFSGRIDSDNGIFSGEDSVKADISVFNHSSRVARVHIVTEVETDAGVKVHSESIPISLYPSKSFYATQVYQPEKPGFYRYRVYLEKDGIHSMTRQFVIGYNPEKIQSVPDLLPDLSPFWDQAKQELSSVNPSSRIFMLPEASTRERNVYQFEIQSLGYVPIKGYFAVPKIRKEEKLPVIVEFTDYGEVPVPPSGPDDGFARMVLSVRGQGLNQADTTYGEFILYGMNSKETYYYRSAYMDLLRGMDFVFSRPEVDTLRVAVMGGGQGGAFALAAAALDPRIKAVVAHMPLLSDFRDYFSLSHWPGNLFRKAVSDLPETDLEMVLNTLSYFDVKNLASRIQCPVLMGVGLQDTLCPPRIHFAAYNQVRSSKEYIVYPEQAHAMRKEYSLYREAWIRKIFHME